MIWLAVQLAIATLQAVLLLKSGASANEAAPAFGLGVALAFSLIQAIQLIDVRRGARRP